MERRDVDKWGMAEGTRMRTSKDVVDETKVADDRSTTEVFFLHSYLI